MRRPSRRRRPVQLAVAALALIVVVWLLLAGPVLGVNTVQVDGVTTLSADQVRETAGIEAGTPLVRVDVEAARARIARLPSVASVEVTRGWPHTVVVTVVERVPIAIVGEPGRRSLVDAEGVLFDTVTGQPPAGVVPLDVADPGPGDPATMAALAAVAALPADVRGQVASAAAGTAEDISLTLTDGTLVRWGGAEESDRKGAALAALIEQLANGDLEPAGTIDVSTPEAVVLR
ncbi:FtsQ-type POTRA domain-containing protein [Blastococcus sp. CT_GayMR16]|uniref:cell division protein FtsQ/DivIB n=1 Tax=Blastococcus sp. CT_GayMR16 TaxID=2559607 RepID=UPI001FD8192F|nr:FtsQ-type POTRA domain-containing protein [Blastococcus sp. CT_GayMR16]